jgi:hypothetical protein
MTDGQQQVQKELLRRRYAESLASTQDNTATNSSDERYTHLLTHTTSTISALEPS